MFLIKAQGPKRKTDIRLRNHDGRLVRIPGHRDPAVARRIGERIERLVVAKQNGDPPPAELKSWIDNMDEGLGKRLIDLGLVPLRHLHRTRRLIEWVPEWQAVVQNRHPRADSHPKQQAAKVQRLITALDYQSLADVEEDAVLEKINGLQTLGCKNPTPLATATRRHYGIAMQDFTEWLAKKLKLDDPLESIQLPSAEEDPAYNRRPVTVKQFQMLMQYLDTFDYYPFQKSPWSAYDRKMVYMTAVFTGYREGELAALKCWSVRHWEKVPVIHLRGIDTKNGEEGQVPIPKELIAALKKYVKGRDLGERLFRFPTTSGSVVDMFRKDLMGAGIEWEYPDDTVIDFHSLRATCITWWLTVNGLNARQVQGLARLKNIRMVDRYARNWQMDEFRWLDRAPKLGSSTNKKAS